MADLSVKFKNLTFKNPIIMASGTFGFGREYNEVYDISQLGGVSGKGLTLNAKPGNNGIRVWETPSGMINSVGLENPGVEGFIEKELPFFEKERKQRNFVRNCVSPLCFKGQVPDLSLFCFS